MRDTATIDTELNQAEGLRYKLSCYITNLALEGVTVLITQKLPDAVQLEVTETDQDMSGALCPSGWIDAVGVRHDIDDDELNDKLAEVLGWLTDSNMDMWREFTADDVSKRHGASPLVVAKLTAEFADGPGPRPDILAATPTPTTGA